MNGFFQRLKQRKLVQWALAYGAAAFALLQGADIVAHRFAWPEPTMRLLIIALTIGLCLTLVLAWFHGERGAQHVTATELLILALILAVGGGLLWRFAGVVPDLGDTAGADRGHRSAASLPVSEKSIAVLPFENLSSDKENTYFAAGIQDEILTSLAKIGDLKVISRSSTQQYQSGPRNLREIARQLGVANILEGSVQKNGPAVHVNVQLIKAEPRTSISGRRVTTARSTISSACKARSRRSSRNAPRQAHRRRSQTLGPETHDQCRGRTTLTCAAPRSLVRGKN